MLCDGRVVCGCADPYAQRVLGDARRSSLHDIWTGETVSALRADLNRGGSAFCGDCPLKLPLAEGQAPPAARSGRAAAAVAPLRRVHGRVQHLVRPGLLRPRNRHHAHAAGRHARRRSLHARRRRGRAVARPHRLLQLRRGVPPQARRGDVRVHQAEVPAHLPLHQHERPRVDGGVGAPARALRDRRGHLLDRRGVAGDLRAIPAARPLRRGDGQPARHGGREAEGRPRRARDQLALHPLHVERQRRGDGARPRDGGRRSASIG